MKDKRSAKLPSNRILEKISGEVAELLEFDIVSCRENRPLKIRSLAINIAKVSRVSTYVPLAGIEQKTSVFHGYCKDGEVIVPVLDLKTRLEGASSGSLRAGSEKKSEGDVIHLSFMNSRLGLCVTKVKRIRYVLWSEIKSVPGLQGSESVYIGHYQSSDGETALLDVDSIWIDCFGRDSLTASGAEPVSGDWSGAKVGVIDDSPVMRQLIKEQLERAGFEVSVYSCAEDFLGSQEAHFVPFTGLVVDIEMPGMSGLNLVDRISSLEEYAATAFLISSSISDGSWIRRAKYVGADDFLTKAELGELASRLEKIFVNKAS